MKRLLFMLLLVSNIASAQNNRQQAFQYFRENYQVYASAAIAILQNTNVDPIVSDILAAVLPPIADENVEAAMIAMSEILYRRKGMKDLNPAYITYMDNKLHVVLNSIPRKDYTVAALTITDIALTTNNFLSNGTLPNTYGMRPRTEIQRSQPAPPPPVVDHSSNLNTNTTTTQNDRTSTTKTALYEVKFSNPINTGLLVLNKERCYMRNSYKKNNNTIVVEQALKVSASAAINGISTVTFAGNNVRFITGNLGTTYNPDILMVDFDQKGTIIGTPKVGDSQHPWNNVISFRKIQSNEITNDYLQHFFDTNDAEYSTLLSLANR
jgi:hypothetical protein